MRKLVIAALAFVGMTLSVQAATVTANNNPLAENLANNPAPSSNSAGFRLNYVGNDLVDGVPPNSRSPWDVNGTCAGDCLTSKYSSVEAGGFARYDFGGPVEGLTLIWGSPDSYNVIDFLDAAGNVIAGQSVFGNNAGISGAAGYVAQQLFMNVTISNLVFYSVVFRSIGSDAFEYVFNTRNVVPSVPIPAGIVLLMTALAGLAGLGRVARRAA